MTTTELTTAADDIRIEPHIAEGLIRMAAEEIDDERVTARLDDEKDFLLVAIRMAQDILITTTMAQTMASDTPFKQMVASRAFGGDDADLQALGQALIDMIMARPRIADPEIPEELLVARYKEIRAAL